jgi:hypothetical protein
MEFNVKKLANPYMAFAISWFLCLFLYILGWSELFPPLSGSLFIFLSVLILIFAFTSTIFNKIILPAPTLLGYFNYKKLIVVNAILYLSNFLYSGIPLLTGTRADDFGIPTIIVIATTLNGFTAVFCFYLFLLTRKRKFLGYILLSFFFFVLAFSRGNIMMSMVTMFFLWINVNRPKVTIKTLAGITTSLLLVMYLFGVAGNYRTINGIAQEKPGIDDSYNSNVILGLGGASDAFKNGPVPGEFFWTYLYVTSPLSNLQYEINKNPRTLTFAGAINIVTDELLFDTFSKRIDNLRGRKRANPDLLVEQLTVPTTLAGSYNYGGWGGMVFFMCVFWAFPFIYTMLIGKNPMGIIGISTLCTVYFFSIFDNMFILTGLTFQLLYPIIFNFLEETEIKWAL